MASIFSLMTWGSLVAFAATYMDFEGPCRQLVSTDRSDAEEMGRSSKVGMHNLVRPYNHMMCILCTDMQHTSKAHKKRHSCDK